MTPGTVRELLGDIIGADILDGLGDDGLLLEDGLVDSMHLVELVTQIEYRLGIPVDADDLLPENFESIAAIVQFLNRQLAVT